MSLVVVCHQLRSADNLGAIARLMANFGVAQLVLSDPVTQDFRAAQKLAVGGEEVLRHVAVARSLPEALGRCVYAVGTTSRRTPRALAPESAIDRLRDHATRGPVALVLGGEKRGLSDEELSHCHDVLAIPTGGLQPSMNVSQAAAVLLYLWSRSDAPTAREVSEPAAPCAESAADQGARGQTLQVLEAKLHAALEAVGWLNPQAPQHALRELVRSLVHGKLTQREAEMWLSALEHVRRVTSSRASPPTG
jgi:tRNA/rRNA methyltransferase